MSRKTEIIQFCIRTESCERFSVPVRAKVQRLRLNDEAFISTPVVILIAFTCTKNYKIKHTILHPFS